MSSSFVFFCLAAETKNLINLGKKNEGLCTYLDKIIML
jgi:hypothetical protein